MKKPWYWSRRGAWYCTVGRSQVSLHKDEATAYEIWHEMTAASQPDAVTASFPVIAESYLAATKVSPAQKKLERYYLVRFSEFIGSTKPAREVIPHDITRWLATFPRWGASSQSAAIYAVKRVYSWAVAEGLMKESPVANVKKPRRKPRESVIDDGTHAKMVAATEKRFRPFLIALRHSGARPGTVAIVTRRDVNDSATAWIIRKHKTEHHTGKPLTIHLSPCLQTLTRILLSAGREFLFVNSNRKPWNRNSINCRFRRLRTKIGLPDGVSAYAYRHTFAHRALAKGVPIASVAELMGHTSTEMVSRVYGHLDQATEHLREAARRATD